MDWKEILEKPYSEIEKIADEMKPEKLRELGKMLQTVSERAGIMGVYFEERHGYGCGDQGHKKAVKVMNRTGKKIHMGAFGFNAYHDINI